MRFRSDSQRRAVFAHLGTAVGAPRGLRKRPTAMLARHQVGRDVAAALGVTAGVGALVGGAILLRNPRAQLAVARRLMRVRHPLPVTTLLRGGRRVAYEYGKLRRLGGQRLGDAAARAIRSLQFKIAGGTPGVRGTPFEHLRTDAEAIRRYVAAREGLIGHDPRVQAEEAISGYRPGLIDKADVLVKRLARPLVRRATGVDIEPNWVLRYGQSPTKTTIVESWRPRDVRSQSLEAPANRPAKFRDTSYQGINPPRGKRSAAVRSRRLEDAATTFLREHGYNALGTHKR